MKIGHMFARIAEEEKPLRFVASRLLARSGIAERLGLKIRRRGYDLRFFNTAMSMTLWLNANERSDDVEIISAMLREGGTYVDIGANIGDLALAGAVAVGATGKVFAFEAHPRIFALMRENLQLNALSNIYPVNAACGATFGWARFSDERSDDMNKIGMGEIVVPTIPADRLLPPNEIDLVKVDVEGFELFVLQGLETVMDRTRFLFIEVGDVHFEQFGYRYADVHDLLTSHGFAIFAQDGSDTGQRWSRVDDRSRLFSKVQNIVAAREGDLPSFILSQ